MIQRSAVALTLALSACTTMPTYRRPDAPVPGRYPEPSRAIAEVPPAPSQAISADVPWTVFFGDTTLRALIELALEENRDLRGSVARVDQARAQAGVARAPLAPNLDAGAGLNQSHRESRTSESWSASLASTSYEVDLFGRLRGRSAQAAQQFLASEAAQRTVQLSLVASVATQYYSRIRAREQVRLASETLVAAEEFRALTRALVDAGSTNELDLRAAESQVQNARIASITYSRDEAQARNALEQVVGHPLSASALGDARLEIDSLGIPEIPAGMPSDLVTRRPDIEEAERLLKAAEANVGVARAAFLPSITLTGSAGTSSQQLQSLFGLGSGIWSFIPQVNLPIFRGGQNRAALASAEAARRAEVANYERVIQVAFREVADALVGTQAASQLVRERARLIEAQRGRLELATARYRQGEDAYLGVLTAQQDLFNAQQAYIDTQLTLVTSRLNLYKALGGGWR